VIVDVHSRRELFQGRTLRDVYNEYGCCNTPPSALSRADNQSNALPAVVPHVISAISPRLSGPIEKIGIS